MTQLTPVDLVRILGHVTLILLVPMVGGTVLGLVIDAMLGTTPLLGIGGLLIGSLVAALDIWLYIRAHPISTTAKARTDEQTDGR